METVTVTEAVYRDATAFDGLVGGEGFILAEMVEAWFRRNGEEKKRKHWRTVGEFLKCREFMAAGTRVIIIPDKGNPRGVLGRTSGPRRAR